MRLLLARCHLDRTRLRRKGGLFGQSVDRTRRHQVSHSTNEFFELFRDTFFVFTDSAERYWIGLKKQGSGYRWESLSGAAGDVTYTNFDPSGGSIILLNLLISGFHTLLLFKYVTDSQDEDAVYGLVTSHNWLTFANNEANADTVVVCQVSG